MKKLVLCMSLFAMASVVWGQSTNNSCLVVRSSRHHERVLSTGHVPFQLTYSSKALRQLASEGVSIVQIGHNERANPDLCSHATPRYAFRLDSIEPQPMAKQEPILTCLGYDTLKDGTVTCTRWSKSQQ
jgi:hypothetical protein